MAFFEDLPKNFENLFSKASATAKNLSDNAKVNALVFDHNKKIDGLYKQLGKLYYQNKDDLEGVDLSGLIAQIDELKSKIEELKVDDSLKTLECPECHTFVEKDSLFCPKCGHSFKDKKDIDQNLAQAGAIINEDAEISRCSNCGNPVSEDDAFCENCGNPIDRN